MSHIRYIVKFLKPQSMESAGTGFVVKLSRKVGDIVKKEDVMMEINLGKANIEEKTPMSGILQQYHVMVDQEIKHGDLLYVLRGIEK